MKIIHTADLHLGSSMKSNFPSEKANIRKEELFSSFINLINYSKDIKIILISGDLFDSEKKVVNRTLKLIESYPDITFFYVLGNHDKQVLNNIPSNLIVFDGSFKSVLVDDVCIGGICVNSFDFYKEINFRKDTKNILLLHANITNSVKTFDDVNINVLKNLNIDYLALGHIHKYDEFKLDERGKCVYPGCLEGRGYDEVGEKGFVIIDTTNFQTMFIKNSIREVIEIEINLTSITNVFSYVVDYLKNYNPKDIIKVILTGSVNVETEIDLVSLKLKLDSIFFSVKIVNKTTFEIDYNNYINEVSLEGEFVKSVINDPSLSEIEKEKILEYGLKSLLGENN